MSSSWFSSRRVVAVAESPSASAGAAAAPPPQQPKEDDDGDFGSAYQLLQHIRLATAELGEIKPLQAAVSMYHLLSNPPSSDAAAEDAAHCAEVELPDEFDRLSMLAIASYARSEAQLRAALGSHVPDEDVLYQSLAAEALLPAHVLVRDRAARMIVLSVRGTAGLTDLIADLAGAPTPFCGSTSHAGMTSCAASFFARKYSDRCFAKCQLKAAAAATDAADAGAADTGAGGVAAAPTSAGSDDTSKRPLAASPSPAASAAAPKAASTPKSAPSSRRGSRTDAAAAAPAAAAAAVPSASDIEVDTAAALAATSPYPWDYGLPAVARCALNLFPGYSFVVVGHSLGAGVGALITCKLRAILSQYLLWQAGMRPVGGRWRQPRARPDVSVLADAPQLPASAAGAASSSTVSGAPASPSAAAAGVAADGADISVANPSASAPNSVVAASAEAASAPAAAAPAAGAAPSVQAAAPSRLSFFGRRQSPAASGPAASPKASAGRAPSPPAACGAAGTAAPASSTTTTAAVSTSRSPAASVVSVPSARVPPLSLVDVAACPLPVRAVLLATPAVMAADLAALCSLTQVHIDALLADDDSTSFISFYQFPDEEESEEEEGEEEEGEGRDSESPAGGPDAGDPTNMEEATTALDASAASGVAGGSAVAADRKKDGIVRRFMQRRKRARVESPAAASSRSVASPPAGPRASSRSPAAAPRRRRRTPVPASGSSHPAEFTDLLAAATVQATAAQAMPIVQTLVVGDDFVPRLTVVSVKELHARLANPELSSAANSALYAATVGPAAAALSRQWESFAATQTGQQAADVVDAVSTTLKRWKTNWFGPSVSARGLGEAYSTCGALPSGALESNAAGPSVAVVAAAASAIEASAATSDASASSSSSVAVAAVVQPPPSSIRDASDAGASISSTDDDCVAPASPMLLALPAAGAASIPPMPALAPAVAVAGSGTDAASGTGEPIYLGPDPPPLSFAEQRIRYFAEAYATTQCSAEQRMVVPGAIYHVTRIPQPAAPAAAAAATAAGAASSPTAAAPQDAAAVAKPDNAGAASAASAGLPAPISAPSATSSAVVAASHAPATPRTAHEISASVHSQVAATDTLRIDPKQDAPKAVADAVTAQAARGEYRVHLVPPSRLAIVRVSPTMWKDHSKRGALAVCKAIVTRQRCARGEVIVEEASAAAAAAPAPAAATDGTAAAIAGAEAATRLLV